MRKENRITSTKLKYVKHIRVMCFKIIVLMHVIGCDSTTDDQNQPSIQWSQSATKTKIKENIKTAGNIDLKPGKNTVEYVSNSNKLVAHVFLPEDYVEGQKLPAIVINPPATGVKEQTTGLYAEELSERGYLTLAFDPAGFGESEGHAQLQAPYKIGEDIKNSVSFVRTLEAVDADNVFSLGVCAGAGYAAYVTAFDTRIKALAVISPYLTTVEQYLQDFNGPANLRTNFFPAGAAARQNYYETKNDTMAKMVPETQEEIDAATPIAIGMRDYYLPGKPGDVPNWKNELSLISIDTVMSFSAYNFTNMFESVPVFVAYGDQAVSAKGAERFYDALKGPKEKLVIEGVGHFELYWKPEHVEPIADGIASFYKQYIGH